MIKMRARQIYVCEMTAHQPDRHRHLHIAQIHRPGDHGVFETKAIVRQRFALLRQQPFQELAAHRAIGSKRGIDAGRQVNELLIRQGGLPVRQLIPDERLRRLQRIRETVGVFARTFRKPEAQRKQEQQHLAATEKNIWFHIHGSIKTRSTREVAPGGFTGQASFFPGFVPAAASAPFSFYRQTVRPIPSRIFQRRGERFSFSLGEKAGMRADV